jgi:Flp pilus assembly protein TadD
VERARQLLLVAAFFICPLIFFTNLTRNPYVTQICLLNIFLLCTLATYAAGKRPRLDPGSWRSALDVPLGAWLAVCALSWSVAYWGHRPFFRPAIAAEGNRAFWFLGVNSIIPYYLALRCAGRENEPETVAISHWVLFTLAWGGLWTVYPQIRGLGAPPDSIWGQVWDGYGLFLWSGGLVAAFWLCRWGRWIDYAHLSLAVGFLASIYGVFQYFNIDFIWPKILNPYGGRAVSTFGNPNFMSSYNVLLLPLAAALFAQSQATRRLAYAVIFLALEAGLLTSLTRSSWLGITVGLGVLALSPDFRRRLRENPRPHGLLFAAALGLALFWPRSSIASGYAPSVIGRLSEISRIADGQAYGPWHQRLLIWTCAWMMGAENPLTGKGWGLFELFYPFYQGPILGAMKTFISLRTHANNAHNELMEVWAQTGLLGLGIFLWLWATFFRVVRTHFGSNKSHALLWAAATAGVAGMLVDNLLNVSLHFAVPGFLFWWLVGSAVGAASPVLSQGKASPVSAAAPSAVPALLWTRFWKLRWGPWVAVALCALSWYWVRIWNREAQYFAGFKLLRQGNFSGAVKHLEISRGWGPPEVNSLYELGNAYARLERFEQARRIYAEALKANTGYDEIFYNTGVILATHLKAIPEAIAYFQMAGWINPLSNEFYNSLGNLYLKDPGRYQWEALKLMKAAVRFFPDNPGPWNNLGFLETLARHPREAQKAYTEALTRDPTLAIAERNLKILLGQSGRPTVPILGALEILKQLEARAGRRDFSDRTLALAQHLVAEVPEMPKARFILGSLLLARGYFSEATGHLEWVAAQHPELVWAHVNLAQAYLGLGQHRQAQRKFQEALAVDPNNVQAREGLRALQAAP